LLRGCSFTVMKVRKPPDNGASETSLLRLLEAPEEPQHTIQNRQGWGAAGYPQVHREILGTPWPTPGSAEGAAIDRTGAHGDDEARIRDRVASPAGPRSCWC
jgi:hypothetical protein